MRIAEETEKLITSRLMYDDSSIDLFEDTIARIMEHKNYKNITCLCHGFDDHTNHTEVMYGLIHAIDYFYKLEKTDQVLNELLNAFPVMYPHARDWIKTLLIRHLHNEITYKELLILYPVTSDSVKDIMMEMLNEIALEDEELFGEKIRAINTLKENKF